MNILKRLFTRKPSIYELRQKYFPAVNAVDHMTDEAIERHMRRADKIANWVLNGLPTPGASSPDRGRGD